jgi:dTDP-4-amino-4,6-dideoxygalactose transaminase
MKKELKSMDAPILFHKPYMTGNEIPYMLKVIQSGKLNGDGIFSQSCHEFLEKRFRASKVLLTTSCTAALEMAAILLDIQMGDEIILPPFTFVSSANAFLLRGAKPVFVDIRPDTLNIDETRIESAVTAKTKAIVPVHYAGISAEMDAIRQIAQKHQLKVVEDAAQGVNAQYKNRFLGTIGDIGAYSFHATKNVTCGEGGAIVLNDEQYCERAEILREKGTNRKKFLRGEIDQYTWVDMGSSFLIADLLAAFLFAQLEQMEEITSKRKKIYEAYADALRPLEKKGIIRLPVIPSECTPNYHTFYILLETGERRNWLIQKLQEKKIFSTFHFIPLHTSPYGKKFGYREGDFPVSESLSKRLLRLPFHLGLTPKEQEKVIEEIYDCLG